MCASVLLQLNTLYFSGLRITNVQSAISKYPIVGFSVAMAVIPVMSAIVVVTLVVIIIIKARQLQKAR